MNNKKYGATPVVEFIDYYMNKILSRSKDSPMDLVVLQDNLDLSSILKSGDEMAGWWKESKKFFLDVQKAQNFYSLSYYNEKTSPSLDKLDFELPFDTVTYIFRDPLTIEWSSVQDLHNYVEVDVLGTVTKKLGKGSFRTYLLISEDLDLEKEGVPISYQYIEYRIKKDEDGYIKIEHIDHYPCLSGKKCSIEDPCWELKVREPLVLSLVYMTEKIHYTRKILKTPKNRLKTLADNLIDRANNKTHLVDYVCRLDGISYKYDLKDIKVGSGSKHSFRYDVRRHPRIQNGQLVWVNPHKRGSGTYIPKVYSNTSTIFLDLDKVIEKATKRNAFIEKLFVFFLRIKKYLSGKY